MNVLLVDRDRTLWKVCKPGTLGAFLFSFETVDRDPVSVREVYVARGGFQTHLADVAETAGLGQWIQNDAGYGDFLPAKGTVVLWRDRGLALAGGT